MIEPTAESTDPPARQHPVPLLSRAISALETVLMGLAGLLLLVMMVAITANAIGRYVFSSPIAGIVELTTLYLMGGVVWLAMSRTQAVDGHVQIDLVMRRLPETAQLWTRAATCLLSVIPVLVIFWGSSHKMMDTWGQTTIGEPSFPIGPSWGFVAAGSALLAVRLLLGAIESMLTLFSRD
jgi:TRAP-type C4-dicarboxylate transport system permease small subunit